MQPGRSAGSGSASSPSPKRFTPSTTPFWPRPRNFPPAPRTAAASSTSSPTARNTAARPPIKEVLRYLQTNNIAVYGTLVGDSARWGEGYVSRFHLPFTMYDNILYKYIAATGGSAGFRAQPERHREELRQDRRGGAQPVHARLLSATSRSSTANTARSMCASTGPDWT